MKITVINNDGFVSFCNLKVGDTFLFDNEVYLKFDRINTDDGDYINAICLNTCEVDSFNAETRVKVVQTELMVNY